MIGKDIGKEGEKERREEVWKENEKEGKMEIMVKIELRM